MDIDEAELFGVLQPFSWDIRDEGRSWSPDEYLAKEDRIPKPELHHGKLYCSDAERVFVFACVMENLGLDKAALVLSRLISGDQDHLADLIRSFGARVSSAEHSIDDALEFVKQSNKRIAAMEESKTAQRGKAVFAYRAEDARGQYLCTMPSIEALQTKLDSGDSVYDRCSIFAIYDDGTELPIQERGIFNE